MLSLVPRPPPYFQCCTAGEHSGGMYAVRNVINQLLYIYGVLHATLKIWEWPEDEANMYYLTLNLWSGELA